MKNYYEKERELYYGNELVVAFIPEIKRIDVLEDRVRNKFTYRYYISVKTKLHDSTQEVAFDSIKDIPFHEYWKECAGADVLSKRQKRLLNEHLGLCVGNAPRNEIQNFGCVGDFNDISESIEWSELAEYLAEMLSLKKDEAGLLFLCKIAAILKPLFEEAKCHMNFYVMVHGKSGKGKTTLSKLFFVQEPEQCRSFKLDNQSSIKTTLEKYQGNTVLVDDYHPEALDYGRKKQISIMDTIARCIDEEETAMPIVTAEFREGSFSVQDRQVQIEIGDEQLQWELFENIQQNIQLYKTLLYRICYEIYKKKEDVIAIVSKKNFVAGEFRIAHNVDILKTVVDVLIYILDEMQLGEIFDKRIAPQIGMKSYFYDMLDKLEAKQEKYMKFLMENDAGIDWIKWFGDRVFENDIFQRIPMDRINKHNDDKNYVYSDGSTLCINEKTLIAGMQKYFSQAGERVINVRVAKNELINELKSDEILIRDKSGANTKKKENKRYYVIDMKRLKLFCQAYAYK